MSRSPDGSIAFHFGYSRVEFIDHNGGQVTKPFYYSDGPVLGVELKQVDGGRTLKVFLNGEKKTP
jgi:hypothetical protein